MVAVTSSLRSMRLHCLRCHSVLTCVLRAQGVQASESCADSPTCVYDGRRLCHHVCSLQTWFPSCKSAPRCPQLSSMTALVTKLPANSSQCAQASMHMAWRGCQQWAWTHRCITGGAASAWGTGDCRFAALEDVIHKSNPPAYIATKRLWVTCKQDMFPPAQKLAGCH